MNLFTFKITDYFFIFQTCLLLYIFHFFSLYCFMSHFTLIMKTDNVQNNICNDAFNISNVSEKFNASILIFVQ